MAGGRRSGAIEVMLKFRIVGEVCEDDAPNLQTVLSAAYETRGAAALPVQGTKRPMHIARMG